MICKLKKKPLIQCLTENKNAVRKTKKKKEVGVRWGAVKDQTNKL